MKQDPLVTVIIPVYNAGEFLQPALNSILNQSYKHLEILLIDDGSSDGCVDGISHLVDSRLKIYKQDNAGKANAVNRALDMMTGELFTLQDADDISYANRIEQQVKAIKQSDDISAVFIGHDLLINNNRVAPTFKQLDAKACKEEIDHFRIPGHDALGLYRRSIVGAERYDPDLKIEEGVDFVLRIGEKYSIVLLEQCLYTYRINYDSTIRRDPSKTIHYVNLVRQRACRRRGIPEHSFRPVIPLRSKLFKHRSSDTHIISHSMESIIQCKQVGRLGDVMLTAWTCIRLRPFDPIYYKPLVYALLPLFFVRFYRFLKQ